MDDLYEIPISGVRPNKPLDLLLINSPLRPNYDSVPKSDYEVLPPIGEAYLASAAVIGGHNVGLIDAEHHGLGIETISAAINKHIAPRIVGINVLTPSRLSALMFAEKISADIPLMIGGPHASALPERTIREFQKVHENTLLIEGEAEIPMTQLLNGDSYEKIPGLWRIEKDEIIKNNFTKPFTSPNLIPPLDHSFLANDPSVDPLTNRLETKAITSRGCPFDCSFCAGSRTSNQTPVRTQPLDALIQELSGLFKTHGAMGIRFIDDLFIASENRVRTILEGIEKESLPMLYWDATGRANILSRFSDNTLDFLKNHGAHEIAIGIESGSERLRLKINKKVNTEDIYTTVSRLIERGINVKGYFIIGLPTETQNETMETFKLAKSLMEKNPGLFRASIFLFRPYPGTKEWTQLINQGYSIDRLLEMHASGVGERAKHSITTELQFAEIPPQTLSELISKFEIYQSNFTKLPH